MELHEIISQLPVGKRKKETDLVDNVVFVMQEFGYTIEEMRGMPIPTFITILESLERKAKAEEAEMRKAKMRRK